MRLKALSFALNQKPAPMRGPVWMNADGLRGEASDFGEGLFEVGLEVDEVLDADREAHEVG